MRAAAVLGLAAAVVAVSAQVSAADVGSPIQVTSAFQFFGIGCAPGTSSCVAVGEPVPGQGNNAVLLPITDGNLGTAFTPSTAGSLGLRSVGCATSTACFAAGALDDHPAVVAVSIGGIGTPMSASAFGGTFDAVACANPTTCVVVGQSFSPFEGLIAPINNGVLGTVTALPQTNFLSGVACQGTNACTAVGSDQALDAAVIVPITDASTTTIGSMTTDAQAQQLDSIACTSSTSCIASGSVSTAGGANNGSEGVVVSLPLGGVGPAQLVPGTYSLGSVACPTASTCVAVGFEFTTCCTGVGVVVPIANGVPGAVTTSPADTEGVACWTTTSCDAVGAEGSSAPGGGNAVVVPVSLAPPTPPAPAFSANPTSVTFAHQHIGTTSAAATVTVTNTGGSPLTFSSVVLGGTNPAVFKITSNSCTGSLAPGAHCATNVTFRPNLDKTFSAVLKYTDNAVTSPQSIPLTGRGCTFISGSTCT